MSPRNSALSAIGRARAKVRQAAVRRQLEGVVSGASRSLAFDLARMGDDAVVVIRRMRAERRWGRPEITRLAAALASSGVLNLVIDGLASDDPAMAVRCARMTGALELERAVLWLEPLLRSDDPAVVEAGARALGSIGGTRSAEALTNAIQRRGPETPPPGCLRTAACGPFARARPMALGAGLGGLIRRQPPRRRSGVRSVTRASRRAHPRPW